jgi:ERO1-like protein alpha
LHRVFSLSVYWERHFSDVAIFVVLFQLELQRNEVIALMNLLHRLSESVKYVHDMSPAAERIAGGHASSGNSFWQRIVTSIAQSKAVSGKRS